MPHDRPVTRNEYLELADWRRHVAALWQAWREACAVGSAGQATTDFRAGKDTLFARHPQSPLLPQDRDTFGGLDYWPYDRAWRMVVPLERDPADIAGPHADATSGPLDLPSSGLGGIAFRRIGRVQLTGPLAGHTLTVFWIDAYGGGLFLPFRDATSGTDTYGAGRYLLDTIKSADHGAEPAGADAFGSDPRSPDRAPSLVLDFNMAYHPSCAYDPRWSCPLAPPESRLPAPVTVGERLPAGTAHA
jgi:uncharacterized protein (DUF1684 family)